MSKIINVIIVVSPQKIIMEETAVITATCKHLNSTTGGIDQLLKLN